MDFALLQGSTVAYLNILLLLLLCAGGAYILKLRTWLQRVRAARSRFYEIADRASDGVVIEEMDGSILWANRSYCDMFGYALEEIVGRKPMEFVFAPEDRWSDEAIANFRFDEEHKDKEQHVRRNMRRNGERFWLQITIGASEQNSSGERTYILVCRDITENVQQQTALENANRKLEHLVRTDPLTGIPNRHELIDIISSHLEKGPVAVAQLDLDHFKDINDSYGHAAGDAVLKHVAETLSALPLHAKHVLRMGGDEFLVVWPDATLGDIFAAMHRYQQALETGLTWQDHHLPIGISIGTAASPSATIDPHELLADADFALYYAKRNGGSDISQYDAALHRRYRDSKFLQSSLAADPNFGGMEVHVQPIVRNDGVSIWGAEALVRWRHPDRGLLQPSAFLDLAQQAGLLRALDTKVLALALQALNNMINLPENGAPLHIAFNASPDILKSNDFQQSLTWECDRLNIPRDRVVVEVHETTVIDGKNSTIPDRIDALSQAGFRVVLDDFGSGQLGLANLGHLNIAGLKLDRSLIDGVSASATSQSLVKAILNLASDLNLCVIAEGVETVEDLDYLRALGCPYIQGFYIAKPMPVDAFNAWQIGDSERHTA